MELLRCRICGGGIGVYEPFLRLDTDPPHQTGWMELRRQGVDTDDVLGAHIECAERMRHDALSGE